MNGRASHSQSRQPDHHPEQVRSDHYYSMAAYPLTSSGLLTAGMTPPPSCGPETTEKHKARLD